MPDYGLSEAESITYQKIAHLYWGIIGLLKAGKREPAYTLLQEADDRAILRLGQIQNDYSAGTHDEEYLLINLRHNLEHLINRLAGEESLSREHLQNVAEKSVRELMASLRPKQTTALAVQPAL